MVKNDRIAPMGTEAPSGIEDEEPMMLTQTRGVTAERSGERVIALDADGETMITLSPVGALVWEYLDEPRTIDAIVDHLASLFSDVPRDQLLEDASAFIAQMIETGLLTET